MKKKIIIVGTVIVSLVLLFGAFMIINGVQRDQAFGALRSFVLQNNETMRPLAAKMPKRLSVECEPKGSMPGHCQAAEYEVSEAECLEILHRYKPDLYFCNVDLEVTHQKQSILISAGDLHDSDHLQLRLILNEKHLLYEYK